MAMLDIFNRPRALSRTEGRYGSLIDLHREMNEMFENFWRNVSGEGNGIGKEFLPKLDVSEDDKAITVAADLPGMEEKDIDVSLSDGILTIRAEHEEKKEEEKKDYHLHERRYGHCHRQIAIGQGIDEKKVSATFKNGVLTIVLPKTPEAKEHVKKIPISA